MRLSLLLLLAVLASCQSVPDPAPCDVWELHVEQYAKKYHQCLEDKGNLRQALKACEERR